jgi:hypothetical protein
MIALVAKRRAVDDQADVAGRDAGFGEDRAHDRQHAFFRRARGQAFCRVTPIADLERDIGEGAADIDA